MSKKPEYSARCEKCTPEKLGPWPIDADGWPFMCAKHWAEALKNYLGLGRDV